MFRTEVKLFKLATWRGGNEDPIKTVSRMDHPSAQFYILLGENLARV